MRTEKSQTPMFACLYLPPASAGESCSPLVDLARDFSPRVQIHDGRTVTFDVSGLGRLLGDNRAIGNELRRAASDRGLRLNIAMAATTTAAMLLARARPGLTIVPPGSEAAALASLSLERLGGLDLLRGNDVSAPHGARSLFKRWGLHTLGDLAALPADELSARLGQDGVSWQKWARGEDVRPMVPAAADVPFEESLDLEWPIEDLEPLSFIFARLFEPLCERLERHDRGAVVLRVRLTLVTRTTHERSLQLPAPMRDARVLRTLALLDLESNPPPAAIDRVAVAVDVTEGRVLQFGLFARALPAERLATLVARLGALMGTTRVGAPALVDSYRPGAFAMTAFAPPPSSVSGGRTEESTTRRLPMAIRRFRSPIPARVTLERGRPVRVVTDRRGFSGGKVARAEGPWRSSGDWWIGGAGRIHQPRSPWNCDEWDVVLSDGAMYRISDARDEGGWFMDGMVD
jgi:protein ImuB